MATRFEAGRAIALDPLLGRRYRAATHSEVTCVATGVDRRSVLKTTACLGLALPLFDAGVLHTVACGEPDPTTTRPQAGDQLVLAAGDGKRDAITPAAVPLAVQSGWGVDAQRMQARIDTFLGTKTDVPQGGVIWVFALGE